MTEADIQTIVQEVMRRMFAENGPGSGSNSGNAGGQLTTTATAFPAIREEEIRSPFPP